MFVSLIKREAWFLGTKFPLGEASFSESVEHRLNMADTETKVKIEDTDPQSVQDLTGFVPFGIFYF